MRDYKPADKVDEISPRTEGFIIISDEKQKPQPSKRSAVTTRPNDHKRISKSKNFLYVSSTTCQTLLQKRSTHTNIVRTPTVKKTSNQTSTADEEHTHSHRSRRLLNEPSYDTETENAPSAPTLLDDTGDVQAFMQVNDPFLSKQLMLDTATIDGSGESKFLYLVKVLSIHLILFLHLSNARANH